MRRERLRDLLVDLGLWGLLSVPVLLRLDPNDGGSWGQVAVGVAVLGGCVAFSRSSPLVSLAVTVAVSLASTVELYTPAYSLALVVFGYLAGRRQEQTRAALALFGAVAAAGLGLVLWSGVPFAQWFTLVLALALAIVAPWLAGRYVRQYARLVRTGWELAERMEREQAAVAERERLRERTRIAGDMHDSLGHDLALIALRAAALEVDPALGTRQQEAAGELRRATADATARLRDIIGVLRAGEEAPGTRTAPAGETVEEVVERARASGMRVDLTVTGRAGESGMAGESGKAGESGEAGPVREAEDTEKAPHTPPMVDRAAHRVVQEALTNAARHAPGAPVRVELERAGGVLTVSVSNPVAGPAARAAAPDPTGGTGLVGLDERVRLAGGRLHHGPDGAGGFTVRAVLPLEPGAAAAAPPAASTAVRERDRARREVRRGLARAIWIPLALVTALGLVMLAFGLWTQARSFLDRDDYAALRVGDPLTADAERLPPHPLDGPPAGAPAEPPGMDRCLYYRSELLAAVPVYRLCLADGRLAGKALVG